MRSTYILFKEEEPKPNRLFKRISETPCMRNSYLYGISGGIATGLAYFMYSSRPRISTHVGFSGFVVTTLSYWFYCRYNYSRAEQERRLLQAFLQGELPNDAFSEGPVSVSTSSLPTTTV